MRKLQVFLEIEGEQKYVGTITGNTYRDACFAYSDEYLDSDYCRPISISLPLSGNSFSSEKTKNFFEGLLPEGFSRRAVAEWIKTDVNDYLSILAVLGKECIGAIKIIENEDTSEDTGYELLSLERVKELAEKGATTSTQILMQTHLSLAGASGKVGLYYDNGSWYLPVGDAPSSHIVKQRHVRLKNIVLNEQLCQKTAKKLGINVPESFIVNVGNRTDREVLFATERYDRKISTNRFADKHPLPRRLHQEDFSQAMGIPADRKYEKENEGYLRRMFEVVRENTTNPIVEMMNLWKMICFSYLVGNTDSHIKNYSLLYSENLRGIELAPAYDIVSTRVYNTTDEMSFYIGKEINVNRIKRSSFSEASKEAGISERIALKILDDTAEGFEKALSESAEELFNEGFTETLELKKLILERSGYRNL